VAGAFCFGLFLGWYTYFVNRYRKSEVQLGDLTTVVGVLGGGAVLALFPAGSDLFCAYGVGLAVGFFAYLTMLLVLVFKSPNFTVDWFLDGRRVGPKVGEIIPEGTAVTVRAMGLDPKRTGDRE
jgi:hypothetical protein